MKEQFIEWEKQTYPEAKLTFDNVTNEFINSQVNADWHAFQAGYISAQESLVKQQHEFIDRHLE